MAENTGFWPKSITGAVSLTFDDGLDSQLENAMPLLDQAQIRGTFYVNPGRNSAWNHQLPRWQLAAERGHEIGNHTERHPCSCNFAFDACYCLEKLNLDDLASTIDAAEIKLDEFFPQQKGRRSFCYPCYQSYVGAGANRQSYVPLVSERFAGARGGGERANHPLLIDLSYTWALDVQGKSGSEMIDFVDRATRDGLWVVLCLHGVGAEHLAVDTEALAELIHFLQERHEHIWTDAFYNITDFIIKRRQIIGAQ
jgi:peptidoglycan/xylan/chitin deacetylase (PgdA/CDA1 family)